MTQETELCPIEDYLPHRGSMLLLDRLWVSGADHAASEAVVREDGLFVCDGLMPAWVGIEYMAQTIAAWAGARAKKTDKPVSIGFLLGSRRYESFCSGFACGDTLRTEVACELISDDGLGMFNCRILRDAVLLAHARVSVYEPEDGAAFLQTQAKSSINA